MNKLMTMIRTNASALIAGLASAAVLSGIAAWRQDEGPWYLVFLVFMPMLSPVLVAAWKIFWFDRGEYDQQFANNEENIENVWSKDAAETGFWTIVSGSLLLWGLGSAFDVSWMQNIGLIHVLVLGAIGFFGGYAAQMREQK